MDPGTEDLGTVDPGTVSPLQPLQSVTPEGEQGYIDDFLDDSDSNLCRRCQHIPRRQPSRIKQPIVNAATAPASLPPCATSRRFRLDDESSDEVEGISSVEITSQQPVARAGKGWTCSNCGIASNSLATVQIVSTTRYCGTCRAARSTCTASPIRWNRRLKRVANAEMLAPQSGSADDVRLQLPTNAFCAVCATLRQGKALELPVRKPASSDVGKSSQPKTRLAPASTSIADKPGILTRSAPEPVHDSPPANHPTRNHSPQPSKHRPIHRAEADVAKVKE